jgi:hypothetical protein
MIPWKDLPIKAVPFAVFLSGFVAFGQMFVSIKPMDITNFIGFMHAVMSLVSGALMTAAGLLFFTKCLRNWPRMRGLDLK